MTEVLVKKSTNPKKKLDIIITDNKKVTTLSIGDADYEDYTIHKDDIRKQKYISRHKDKEDWTYGGRFTKGYWSYNLLWRKKSLNKAIEYLNNKYKSMNVKKAF